MDLREFIAGLPKAELHMHLEGSLEPEMMFDLASRNEVDLPWGSPEEVRGAYRFTDLQSFLDLFYQGLRVLVRTQDFHDLACAYLKRAHADNVVHAEVFLGPQSFFAHGVDVAAVMDGTLTAIDDARRDLGITAGLLVIVQRHRTEADAFALLEAVMPWADRIAGFGMGGAEVGNPPSKFADFFAECRRRGFRVTTHAGEEGPAGYVREAVDVLHVDRIDHGNASLDDPVLLGELVERKIPLTVCPVSNLKLNVVSSLGDHPLPRMLKAGLRVSVNSDDPTYFGAYVNENLWRCHTEMGLSRDDLATLARNSFLSSFLPAEEVTRHLASVDAYCAAFDERAGV